MTQDELTAELADAEALVKRLRRAAGQEGTCPDGEHERRCRQSVCAVSGHSTLKARVRELTGYELPHAGYHLYECIACGQWSIDDYCGEKMGPVTAEAAEQLG